MQQIISVSELNKQAKIWLEQGFSNIHVKGEISNLARPASQHLYFTLKDESAQVKCAYFRHSQNGYSRTLENGQSVILLGKVTLYEARGDYQIIVNDIIPDGEGILLQQIEHLKHKLKSEGLFDEANKKPLPVRPKQIGVITSATGAAIHDILTTLTKRYPIAKVNLYCCEVQGANASTTIIRALHTAIRDKNNDVLIIARGGGSLEDLMPFNDEQLARNIYHSPMPIISGVGHETDFTICDFVADYRAATPTGAAQASCPDQLTIHHEIQSQLKRINLQIKQLLTNYNQTFKWLIKALLTPTSLMFNQRWQTLDYLQMRLTQTQQRQIQKKQNNIQVKLHQLQKLHPKQVIQSYQHQFSFMLLRLQQTMASNLRSNKQRLENSMITLHALSPLATLNRGYSIATHNNAIITDPFQVNCGDIITLRVKQGVLSCEVKNRETQK